jgi:glycosyltransferase involved in cell wall biosynthesis
MTTEKVLKVALYDASSGGGVCHYTHQLATQLAESGHEVIVVTNEGYELNHLQKKFKTYFLFRPSTVGCLLRWLGWRETRAPKEKISGAPTRTEHHEGAFRWLRIVRLFFSFPKFILFVWTYRPHVIHFQWVVRHEYEYYLVRVLRAFGFKTIYTVHDLLPQESDTPTDRKARGRLYRAVDRLIVHAEADKRELSTAFAVNADRIATIPHGSNDFFYMNGNSTTDEIRRELGIDRDKTVVLFFGIIRRYKGLEYLVEAFKTVAARLGSVSLLIVGAIYKGDAEAYGYYSALIDQLRTDERVRCVPDYVPVEKVGSYFTASDLVVLPYVKTYTSGVLLTAYAAGKPVIVTNTGTLREVVEDGKTGYVVPPRDVDALAKAMIDALETPGRLELMGRRAKELAETRYSWRAAAAATANVYRSVLRQTVVREALQRV